MGDQIAGANLTGNLVGAFLDSLQNKMESTLADLRDQVTPGLIESLPSPTYTSLEEAADYLRRLSTNPDLPAEYRDFFQSNPKTTALLTKGRLNLRKIQTLFEGLLDIAIATMAKPGGAGPANLVFQGALHMIGAVSLIPDQLMPSLHATKEPDNYEGPSAEWLLDRFDINIHIVNDKSSGEVIINSMLHEFRHMLQAIRGIQLGMAFEMTRLKSPLLIAALRLYFPTLEQNDIMFDHAASYYDAHLFHMLSYVIMSPLFEGKLSELKVSELRKIAELFGVSTKGNAAEIAHNIYLSINTIASPDIDQLRATLESKGLSANAIEVAVRIAELKLAAYFMNPNEVEVYAMADFGLEAGNPMATLETMSGRGLLQLPLKAGDRKALFEELTLVAELRRVAYQEGADILGVRMLLGGKEISIPFGSPRITSLAQIADPKYEVLDTVSGRLSESVQALSSRIERISNQLAKRVEIK